MQLAITTNNKNNNTKLASLTSILCSVDKCQKQALSLVEQRHQKKIILNQMFQKETKLLVGPAKSQWHRSLIGLNLIGTNLNRLGNNGDHWRFVSFQGSKNFKLFKTIY